MLRFLPLLVLLLAPMLVSAEQTVFVDQGGTWPLGGLQRKGPSSLTAPVDFTSGPVYLRYEAVEKPTDFGTCINICMWQDSNKRESCSFCPSAQYETEGVYYWKLPPMSEWWQKYSNNRIDYNRPFQTFRLLHQTAEGHGTWLYTCGGRHCYKGSAPHIPIEFRVTAILTTEGHAFQPPADWSGCPAEWGCAGGVATSDASASGPTCHLINPGDAIPAGFGAPYDVRSAVQELLISGTCSQSGITARVGTGAQNQLVYHKAYAWHNNGWRNVDLQSTRFIGEDQWLSGEVTGVLKRTLAQLSQPNFFVAYICSHDGSQWRCGCRDATCAQGHWQLQVFRAGG